MNDSSTNGQADAGIMDSRAARDAQRMILAFSIILYCWFLTPLPNWNIASRNALASSIVLDHKLDIDRYKLSTGDIACVGGHFFSDKAPGIAWMSLPPLTVYSIKKPVEPRDPWQLYFMTLFAVAIPSCLLNVLLFRFSLHVTRDMSASLLSTLAFGFSTLAFPYSTLLYSHQTVAFIMFALFYLGYYIRTDLGGEAPSAGLMTAAGFLFGLLFVTEHPAALPGAFIGLYMLAGLRGTALKVKSAATLLLAAMVPAACWAAYNMSVFGKVMEFGYHHECLAEFSQGMSEGLRGFNVPEAKTFFDLLLLPGRGLFAISPVLLLAIPGVATMARKYKLRAEAVVCVAIAAVTLLLNAAVFQPSGGASLGPRYLEPMLPFCALAISAFLAGRGRLLTGATAGMAAVSFMYMLCGTATNPQPPRGIDSPYFSYVNYFIADRVFRPGLMHSVTANRLIDIAPPLMLCVAVAAVYLVSSRKRGGFSMSAVGASAFAAAFAGFAIVSIYLGVKEAKRLPVHVQKLAVADYYAYLKHNREAARHYADSFSGKYSLGAPEGKLWPVCEKIAVKFSLHEASACIYAANSTGAVSPDDFLSFAASAEMAGRHIERMRLLAYASAIFFRSPEIRAAYARELLLNGDAGGAVKEAEAALILDPHNRVATETRDSARKALKRD